MPVPIQSVIGGEYQAYKALSNSVSSALRVSLPGIIHSFDPVAVTCEVQPAIKGTVRDGKGGSKSVELPMLVDVPVIFPRGGGCTITFPVKAGDECLLLFSDRCIDFWWQSGGVQEPVDPRQHDLSDAFALVGPQSQAQKIADISTDSLQIRTDEGSAFIALAQSGAVTINTSLLTINGNVSVNGEVTTKGNVSVHGGITSTGDQIAQGISQATHVHGGIQGGNSVTKVPQ